MTKKIALILIILIVLIALGLGAWFFLSSSGENGESRLPANFFGDGIPFFGNGDADDSPNPTDTTPINDNMEPTSTYSGALLEKISQIPVSGYHYVLAQSTSTTGSLRYVEQETGHVYSFSFETGQAERLSNRTILATNQIVWGPTGDELLMQYVPSGNQTFVYAGTLVAQSTSTEGTINGSELTDNVVHMVSSPDNNQVFMLLLSGSGVTGVLTDSLGRNRRELFYSSYTEWLPSWPHNDTIYLTTKASGEIPGHLYEVRVDDGEMSSVLTNIDGLTANPGKGDSIIYSTAGETDLNTAIFYTSDKTHTNLSLKTLPEKCAWGHGDTETVFCAVPHTLAAGRYPDLWYQGFTQFDDAIWLIDANRGTTEEVLSLSAAAGEPIDAVNLQVSPDNSFLFFMNKRDGSLWNLRLADI